jgi:hypothetical protein
MLAVALAGVACTAEGDVATPPPSPDESPLPTVDVDVRFVEGEYEYEKNDVTVALSWNGGTGELTVDNGSGAELGSPSLYAVTPQQTQVLAEIAEAAPIADGGSATLAVAFPDSLRPEDAGLVAIRFGDQNWGALSPVVIVEDEG